MRRQVKCTCVTRGLVLLHLLPALTALAQSPTAVGPLPPAQWERLTERLQNNLGQVEALATARIVLVTAWSDGIAQVSGFIAEESQRREIEIQGFKALQREANNKLIPLAITRLDTSYLVVLPPAGSPPLNRVATLDRFFESIPQSVLRVQMFDPARNLVQVCGAMSSQEHLRVLQNRLPVLKEYRMTLDDVIVADAKMPRVDYTWGYNDVNYGLRGASSEVVLSAADQMIRLGYSSSEAWYFRAVGCLLAGRDMQALGALRIATSLESSYSYFESKRFQVLERFQGSLREKLERMIALQPANSIVCGN